MLDFMIIAGDNMVHDHSQGMAIVTGASSGIGEVQADRLAARREAIGCSWLPRRARLQALAADLQSKHRANVTTFVADLDVSEDLAGLASRIGEEDVAMLINNAGGRRVGINRESQARQKSRRSVACSFWENPPVEF